MTAVRRPLESECTNTVIAAALTLGYHVHHCRPALAAGGWRTPIQGRPGFPDLIIVGHGKVIVAELKRKPNRIEPAQQAWLDAFAAAGITPHVVWVPEGQQSFIDLLTTEARS